jgi:hypothetical protein
MHDRARPRSHPGDLAAFTALTVLVHCTISCTDIICPTCDGVKLRPQARPDRGDVVGGTAGIGGQTGGRLGGAGGEPSKVVASFGGKVSKDDDGGPPPDTVRPPLDGSIPEASGDSSASDGDASRDSVAPKGSPGERQEGGAPCGADFEGLPVSAFVDCFAYWASRGRRLQTIAVRPDGTEIAGSFQPGSFDGYVHMAMDAAEFDRQRTADRGEPWLVRDLSIYRTAAGELRYAAVFEPSGGAEVVTFRDLEPEKFTGMWDIQYKEEFTLTDLFVEQKGVREVYSGTWVKRTPFVDCLLRTYTTLKDFTIDDDGWVKLGYRVSHLIGYVDYMENLRYWAIWESASHNRFAAVSGSTRAYVADRRLMTSYGYRLERVQLYDSESYSAIWVGPHEICSTGAKLFSNSDPCVTMVCQSAPACCNSAWTDSCIAEAQEQCGRCLNAPRVIDDASLP